MTSFSTALIPYAPLSWEEHYQCLETKRAFRRLESERALGRPQSVRIMDEACASLRGESCSIPPFPGTMLSLVALVEGTVSRVLDHTDYNGLMPFLEVLRQIDEGKPAGEIHIESLGETRGGSMCVGKSRTLLAQLRLHHGIEGTPIIWKRGEGDFHHMSVIIECSDGIVHIDPTDDTRISSVRFGEVSCQEIPGRRVRFFSLHPEKAHPFVVVEDFLRTGEREENLAYALVANGADVVMKQCLVQDAQRGGLPICMPRVNGESRKRVFLNLPQREVILKNLHFRVGDWRRTCPISFDMMGTGAWFGRILDQFMQPRYPYAEPTFATPSHLLLKQLKRVIRGANKIQWWLCQTNPRAVFESTDR